MKHQIALFGKVTFTLLCFLSVAFDENLYFRCAALQQELDTSETVQKDFVKLSQNLQIELEKIRQAEQVIFLYWSRIFITSILFLKNISSHRKCDGSSMKMYKRVTSVNPFSQKVGQKHIVFIAVKYFAQFVWLLRFRVAHIDVSPKSVKCVTHF